MEAYREDSLNFFPSECPRDYRDWRPVDEWVK